MYSEATPRFLARMILATREQQQISSADARRLSDLATHGDHRPTTMPEERRLDRTVVPTSPRPADLVRD